MAQIHDQNKRIYIGCYKNKIDAVKAQLASLGCNGKVDLQFTDITTKESKVTITLLIKSKT